LDLNEKTGIVDFLKKMNNNRLRRVAESMFPLACQYVLGDQIVGQSYDGIYYDGVNTQPGKKRFTAKQIGIGDENQIEQVCKNKYFSKITLNRRPIHTK
jgi:hypothetical protein